jgi:hypothetical protein
MHTEWQMQIKKHWIGGKKNALAKKKTICASRCSLFQAHIKKNTKLRVFTPVTPKFIYVYSSMLHLCVTEDYISQHFRNHSDNMKLNMINLINQIPLH